MTYIDLTLPTPAENLAYDESLLDFCECAGGPEILRLWEPTEYFVVVGYANKVDLEVNREACDANGIPIFRRCSGGGTVVQGRGCLNFSVILNFSENEALQTITRANQFIMGRHRELFNELLGNGVSVEGHTDLALNGLKFSGNAQRRKKNFLLFHGTFLLNFDIPLIERLLRMPSQQPEYRHNRPHERFLINVEMQTENLKYRLQNSWKAFDGRLDLPDVSKELVGKYQSEEWRLKF